MHKDGFIALIECDPAKSGAPDHRGMLKSWQVFRTGTVTFLQRETFFQLFDIPASEKLFPCVFVEAAVTQLIKSRITATSHWSRRSRDQSHR